MGRRLWITFQFGKNVSKTLLTAEFVRKTLGNRKVMHHANGFTFSAIPTEQLQELMQAAWEEIAKHNGMLYHIQVRAERLDE